MHTKPAHTELKPTFFSLLKKITLLSLVCCSQSFVFGQTDRDPNTVLRVATVQAGENHYQNGNPGSEANFNVLANQARAVAAENPDIIVFPEYAISGWPYPQESILNGLSEAVPGDGVWLTRYKQLAQEIQIPIVAWMLENGNGKLYNCAVFIDGQGNYIGKYRKVHANLGEQTSWGWSQGDSFQPIELNGVRYGISICSDMWHPETVLCSTLMGADVILHMSIGNDMRHIIPARGFDTFTPIVASIFQGSSYAVDGYGNMIGSLPAEPAGYGVFEVKPFHNYFLNKYGGGWDKKDGRKNMRNPQAYSAITDPSYRPAWTEVFLTNQFVPQTREQILARFNGRYDQNDTTAYRTALTMFNAPWNHIYNIDPNYPHHFVNGHGNHLYVLGKPALAYFGCQDPEAVVQRAASEGATVLRVALEGTPYANELGIDLWPWGGSRNNPKWGQFNEAYWNEVEHRIRLAGNAGLGIDLVLYHTFHPNGGQLEEQKLYWDQIIRRLSKYSNILTWEIANEYTSNPVIQQLAAEHFYINDPYYRPVSTSSTTSDDATWTDKNWIGLAINHSATSSDHGLKDWYLPVARNARNHGRPAWCNQSGDEVRDNNTDPVHRRKQAWIWNAAGCFWTYQTKDGCEGINDANYQGPGVSFMKPMADFWKSIAFWTLSPNETAVSLPGSNLVYTSLADTNRTLIVSYICTESSGAQSSGTNATLRLPEGSYQISFVQPSDGATLSTQTITSSGIGQSISQSIPGFTDDLVVVIRRQ